MTLGTTTAHLTTLGEWQLDGGGQLALLGPQIEVVQPASPHLHHHFIGSGHWIWNFTILKTTRLPMFHQLIRVHVTKKHPLWAFRKGGKKPGLPSRANVQSRPLPASLLSGMKTARKGSMEIEKYYLQDD